MHLMIDIETFGTSPTSVVSQVSMVAFTANAVHPMTFNRYVELQPQLDSGRKVSEDTLLFWLSDNVENSVRKGLHDGLRGNAQSPQQVLAGIQNFPAIKLIKLWSEIECIWSKGPSFDIVILESLAATTGVVSPFQGQFRKFRDVRTAEMHVQSGLPYAFPAGIGPHDGLYDCYKQISTVQNFLKGEV